MSGYYFKNDAKQGDTVSITNQHTNNTNDTKERELSIRTAFEVGWLTCKDYWEINDDDDYLSGDYDALLAKYIEDQS